MSILDRMLQQPAASIRDQQATLAETEACYRFLEGGRVKPEDILEGHQRATVERMQGRQRVLLVQDTTAVSLAGLEKTTGLGPITSSPDSLGYLVHTTLAVDPDKREPLGVLGQQAWARKWETKRRTETPSERKSRDRESEHWMKGQELAARALGRYEVDGKWSPIPKGTPELIAVFDREGDIFEAFEKIAVLDHGFVIRATRNRLIEGEETAYSLEHAAQAPVLGSYELHIAAKPGKAARTAVLEVRAERLSLRPPKNRDRKGNCFETTIVHAAEINPPEGVEAVEWFLLTHLRVSALDEALDVIKLYTCRWIVEEFHMGLKTGVAIEKRQFESLEVHLVFLAFASIAAWALLALRSLARRPEEVPASTVLSPEQLKVLKALDRRLPKEPTARQALRSIAGLGGFMGRKGDGEPGWRTLSRGYHSLLETVRGYVLAMAELAGAK